MNPNKHVTPSELESGFQDAEGESSNPGNDLDAENDAPEEPHTPPDNGSAKEDEEVFTKQSRLPVRSGGGNHTSKLFNKLKRKDKSPSRPKGATEQGSPPKGATSTASHLTTATPDLGEIGQHKADLASALAQANRLEQGEFDGVKDAKGKAKASQEEETPADKKLNPEDDAERSNSFAPNDGAGPLGLDICGFKQGNRFDALANYDDEGSQQGNAGPSPEVGTGSNKNSPQTDNGSPNANAADNTSSPPKTGNALGSPKGGSRPPSSPSSPTTPRRSGAVHRRGGSSMSGGPAGSPSKSPKLGQATPHRRHGPTLMARLLNPWVTSTILLHVVVSCIVSLWYWNLYPFAEWPFHRTPAVAPTRMIYRIQDDGSVTHRRVPGIPFTDQNLPAAPAHVTLPDAHLGHIASVLEKTHQNLTVVSTSTFRPRVNNLSNRLKHHHKDLEAFSAFLNRKSTEKSLFNTSVPTEFALFANHFNTLVNATGSAPPEVELLYSHLQALETYALSATQRLSSSLTALVPKEAAIRAASDSGKDYGMNLFSFVSNFGVYIGIGDPELRIQAARKRVYYTWISDIQGYITQTKRRQVDIKFRLQELQMVNEILAKIGREVWASPTLSPNETQEVQGVLRPLIGTLKKDEVREMTADVNSFNDETFDRLLIVFQELQAFQREIMASFAWSPLGGQQDAKTHAEMVRRVAVDYVGWIHDREKKMIFEPAMRNRWPFE